MDLDWDDTPVAPVGQPATPLLQNDEPPQSSVKRPATRQATKKRPAADMKHGATDPGKHVVVANVPLPDEDSGVDDAKHRREPRPSERIVNPNNDPTSVGAVTLLAKPRDKNLLVGHQRITVGSDCAGMGSELFALRGLGVNFQHCWASDIEPHVKKFHEAVHGCKAQWFDSIAQRNAANTCATDLYVAGFPCQPFSNAGRNAGIHDTRGNVFFEIAAHLEKALP